MSEFGGVFTDTRLRYGVGIEDTFIPQEGLGHRKLDEYELTQHYRHWREDLELVARSGAEFLRWGIPWYLVEPEPGRFDWRWIDRVADHMRDLGLRCVVDLMHYGTPLWMENAFLNAAYPERVAAYAAAVAARYSEVWTTFTPLNEPHVNAEWCGQNGAWPPYLTGQDGFVRVLMQLARGMIQTQRAIAAVNPDATFVHVDAGLLYEGDTSPLPIALLEERRFVTLDLITGRISSASPIHPYLLERGVTDADLAWFADNAVTPDVVGINYYPAFSKSRIVDGAVSPVPAGTEGLKALARLYSQRYHLPMAITETSLVGTPDEKTAWLLESTVALEELRREGHAIVGYTWFPFFTLVDWQYRFRHDPPDAWFMEFGLVDLVRGADQDLERVPTPALETFRTLALSARGGSETQR